MKPPRITRRLRTRGAIGLDLKTKIDEQDFGKCGFALGCQANRLARFAYPVVGPTAEDGRRRRPPAGPALRM
jgi:hypothetical protein